MPLQPGTRLGHYEVANIIGVGGMGEVYRATDTNLQRAVAGDPVAGLQNPSLAPDESRVVFNVAGGGGLWISGLRRNVSSRLLSEGNDGTWSPDGSRVAFDVGSKGTVLSVPANGGTPSLLFQATDNRLAYVEDWHPDGDHLALILVSDGRDQGVVVGTKGDQTPVMFDEARDLDEMHFSPDGKWIAYNADRDGGGMEVYVVPYPPTGERVQVSSAGGVQARWRADGRELFYLTPEGTLMAVAVSTDRGFRPDIPTPLFATGLVVDPIRDQYAVTRDGRRFLLAVPADTKDAVQPPQIVIVENWVEELKRLVPTE